MIRGEIEVRARGVREEKDIADSLIRVCRWLWSEEIKVTIIIERVEQDANKTNA